MSMPKDNGLENNSGKGGSADMAKKSFHQDAKTGKIVSSDYAKKHPNTTIKHTFNTKKGK